ncbi:helix-turn-helix transcriptional regulator [Selenomonas sp. FC4001]|uniref:helix-turn-helix transcriptional regulator n=1 Tax=Selenomonas sp. FC4001 TaxID=1408313 RepID=UPI0005658318|nr:helix-turn-helix transcriptional regulator [Selenomonas sp. FC4001]MDD6134042.1 helix-turn-helix transcriptional regulator [Selenomonadaceae bacterium]
MPDKNKIGERLRQLRGHLPRESVANACGVSLSALSMYENGERIPRDEVKVRFAKFFGKSVQAIFFAD